MTEYIKYGFSGVILKPHEILELSTIIHEIT